MRIGFVGAGSMAGAMARGWHAASEQEGSPPAPERLSFTDAGSGRGRELADEVGGEIAGSNEELAERSDLLVLAVKPKDLDGVAEELSRAAKPVISLLAATPLERVREAVGSPVLRVLPNLGVQVRRGVLCHAASDDLDDDLRQRLIPLLRLLGTPVAVDDALMDAATAIMSCSPAYFALVAEVLIDAGVSEGIDRGEAELMVGNTLTGTGELLEHHRPAALREAVASPGGSTEAGLAALESHSVRASFEAAVEASLARMRE
jgi:pyrroline-5-carboxylate reductase